jgi:hypothetical protein
MKNEKSIRKMLEYLQVVATPEAIDDPARADEEGLQCAYAGAIWLRWVLDIPTELDDLWADWTRPSN